MKFKIILFAALLLVGAYTSLFFFNMPNPSMFYGVSFSPEYAGYLHVDPAKAYKVILDDWGFKYIRLTAQWNKLEPAKGKFDFKEMDWQMNEAEKRGAKVTLVVGQKLPRWPECYVPEWARVMPLEQYQTTLAEYMTKVVERYKKHPALEIWQVENEPFLSFGAPCPLFSRQDLAQELALVKKLDPAHPTLVTDSGELSVWHKTAGAADLFGATLYRVVYTKYIGYWSYWWLPASVYRFKFWVQHRSLDTAYISELQAEPWLAGRRPEDVAFDEQFKSMSLERLKKNIVFSQKVGVPRAYLWGAEWWYWLGEHNHPEFGEYVKNLKKQ